MPMQEKTNASVPNASGGGALPFTPPKPEPPKSSSLASKGRVSGSSMADEATGDASPREIPAGEPEDGPPEGATAVPVSRPAGRVVTWADITTVLPSWPGALDISMLQYDTRPTMQAIHGNPRDPSDIAVRAAGVQFVPQFSEVARVKLSYLTAMQLSTGMLSFILEQGVLTDSGFEDLIVEMRRRHQMGTAKVGEDS